LVGCWAAGTRSARQINAGRSAFRDRPPRASHVTSIVRSPQSSDATREPSKLHFISDRRDKPFTKREKTGPSEPRTYATRTEGNFVKRLSRRRWILLLSARASQVERASSVCLFAKVPIHQLFGKLYTDILEKLGVLLDTSIQRQADLPRACEGLGIFDRRLVQEMIRACCRVPLHDVQLVAVKISRPVEPGVLVETGYVDDKRLSFPVTPRAPNPELTRTLFRAVHVDDAARVRKLVGHENLLWRLNDLKRIALIGGAWDARHVALDFRVACQPVCPVFVSFGQRFRPV